jgi:hypothetical protein
MMFEPTSDAVATTAPRRALEALRNGVPNRDAVRVLGCDQPEVEELFLARLADVQPSIARGTPVQGLLVSGDFGTGKSHVLEHLQDLAVSQHFVCSRVVTSKETPLYDLGKVFKAAVDTAEVPDHNGPAVSEIALKLKPDSPAYVELYRWVHSTESGLSTLFPATLLLYERLKSDPELTEKLTNFWAGERLPIADVRGGLRQIGELPSYPVRAVKLAQLARERFAFLSRFILGAGYAGWVILIDEVELIGRYSILQRGKSYAELARLLGQAEGDGFPGIAVVATITDDFGIKVLGEKGDLDNIGPKLRSKGTDEWVLLAARAETGMRVIDRDRTVLVSPDEMSLRNTYDKLRRVHAEAYGWEPPDVWAAENAPPRRMRSHVRRWIAEWDLQRLYPGSRPQLEEQELHVDYGEDVALEQVSEGATEGDVEG